MDMPNEQAMREYERGMEMVEANRPQDALAAFQRAVKADPTFLLAQVGVISAYLELEQPDKALTLLAELEARQPNDFNVLYAMGSLHYAIGNFDQAMEAYDRAAEVVPDAPDAYLLLGEGYASVDAIDDAYEMAEAAIALDPNFPDAHAMLGRLRLHDGDEQGAEVSLRQAVKLDPGNVPALFSLGTCLIGQENYPEARDIFIRTIDADPDFAMSYLGLATAYAALDNTAEALKQARQARVRAADNPDALFGIAQLYQTLGHPVEARALAEQTVETDPQFAEAYAFLYFILLELGDTKAANAAFAKLRELDPDLADDVIAEIDDLQQAAQAPAPKGRGKAKTEPAAAPTSPGTAFQLKITLKGSKPPIWRRVVVPGTFTLGKLHAVIQVAMGWEDSHLHAFRIGSLSYSDARAGLEQAKNETRVKLVDVLTEGSKFTYEYDFGDGWEHQIVVEKVLNDPTLKTAECLTGKLAGPLEDSGGIYGYYDLLETLKNPDDPEYADMREWAGEFDPATFNLDAVNARLKKVK